LRRLQGLFIRPGISAISLIFSFAAVLPKSLIADMKKFLALGLGLMLAYCGYAQSASDAYAHSHLKGPNAVFEAPWIADFVPTDSIAHTGSVPAGICPGGSINLHALHSQPGSTYQWTLNGLPISGATDSLYTATTPGDYSIVVVNGSNTFNWPTLTVVAHPVPAPDFSFAPNGQCSNVPVSFTNLTPGSGNTYSWDFNDPNSGSNNASTLTNPAHFFAGPATGGNQTFAVVLTATNSFGCSDSLTRNVNTISPSTNLGGSGLVVFNGNPVFTSCTSTGATLTFANQSATAGTNIDYTIIWGDASSNFSATTFTNVNHTYATGTYTLSFIVTGAGNCRDTGFYTVYIGSNPAVGLSNPGNTITCSESSLTFPITSTNSNSPGTTYTVTFNDGSAPQNFNHPAPASVSHTFQTSSCGTTSTSGSTTYQNAFSATIKATNPCGSSSASIVPIYVSKKPKAILDISPNDTVCTNVGVFMYNNSGNMNSVSNGVCTPGKAVWTITPATGWNQIGTPLGSTNSSPDPAFWTAGASVLNIVFTAPGTYIVRMQVGNTTLCQTDETYDTICVNGTPVVDFNLSATEGCGPLLVNALNASSAANCGPNTYGWTVSYVNPASCTPNSSSWSFTGGTAANSPNPSFNFVNPGVYSIDLRTTPPGNTCFGTLTKTVTVKAKPNVTFNALADICTGPFSPVASANDCFSSTSSVFSWTFTGATPATGSGQAPTTNYNTPGLFNVQLAVTNECGTTNVTQPLYVNPTPIVNQPADIVVCNTLTAPATVFTSPVAGVQYNWTNSNPAIGLAGSGNGNVPAFTAVNTGSSPIVATITVTPFSTTCSGPSKSFTITVNPTPPINAGPDQIICNATTATMAAVLAPGTTGQWSQISGPAASITSASSPTTTITGLLPMNTYQFKWLVTGTGICNTVGDTVTILNRPLPSPANAGPDTLICNFNGTPLTFNLSGNAVVHPWELGIWTEVTSANTTGSPVTINNPTSPNSSISGVGLGTGINQGLVKLVWSIANDAGCPPTNDTMMITVVRKPLAGTIAPIVPRCYGDTVTFTASGYTGTIVKWNRKDAPLNTNPWVSLLNNTSTLTLNNLQDSVALQFIVGSFNPLCPQRDTATAIIPVGKPIINTLNPRVDSACSGDLYNSLSPLASGGDGSAPQYQWQSSLTGSNFTDLVAYTNGNLVINVSQTIWFRRLVTIGTCSSVSDTIKVWVENPITNNTIAANQTICVNTAPAPLTGSLPTGGSPSQPLTYQWESSSNGSTWNSIAGATAQNYAPAVLTATTYFRRIVSSPRCPSPTGGISNIDTITITPKPTASFVPSVVTGCSPLTVTFANNTLGAGNSYTWTWGDGSANVTTSSNASLSHTFITGTARNFTVRLVAQNTCGVDSMKLDIFVQPNSANLSVTVSASELAGCAPHTVTFYNSTTGASNFQWNFNDGSPVLFTTRSIDTVVHTFNLPGTYNVSIRALNNCTDTTGFRTITVYQKPTAAFTPSSLTACVGNSFTFTNNSTSATNYLWRFSDGSSTSVPSPTKSFAAAGTYQVKLIAYNTNGAVTCADSVWLDVTVGATQSGSMTVTATSSPCAPLTATFTNNTSPSTSVLWNFGDGSPTSSLNTVQHTFTASGIYTVTLTVNTPSGCIYTSTQNITVGGPSGQLLYTGGYKCNNQGVQFNVTGAGASSYDWDFGNGVVINTATPSINYVYPGPGVFLPQLTLNGGGCAIVLRGIDTIRIERMVKGFSASLQNFCDSTRVNFQDTSSAFFGKALVQWNFGSAGTATGSSPSITLTNTTTLNVMMVLTSNSGCTDTTRRQLPVTVWNTPNVTMVEPPNFRGCARQPVLYDAVINSADAISNVQWTTNNGINATSSPFRPNFATPGTYNVTLTVSTVNGCTRVVNSNPLTINPTPTVDVINPPGICRGGNTQINTNVTGTNTYNWSPTNGLSCTTCPNPVASPDSTTTYILTVTNGAGCSAQDTTTVFVTQPVTITVTPASDSLCIGESVQVFASGATTFNWTTTSNPSDLSCTSCANPVFTPSLPGQWQLTVTGTNSCFTQSVNIPVGVGNYPSVNLGPDLLLPAGTIRPLTSTVTGGPITGWLWSPATDLSCTTCPLPSATVRNAITYVVEATTAFGCTATDTLSIRSFCDKTQAYIPNAFSPDGDGINDVLMVRGSGIVQVKSFRIFNRWGEVVFERANFAPNDPAYGWDGKVKGTVTAPDVFVYMAEVICENGTSFTYKGNVSVLK
jgi:gliding motility-associated-like protein